MELLRHCTLGLLAVSVFIIGIEMAPHEGLPSPLLGPPRRDGVHLLPLDSELENLKLGRDDEDDENSAESATTEATSTTRLGFQSAGQRVVDYGGGVLGIVSSAATLNLKGILHGSTQFIPPHIRVGVEDILGSIIGSPLNPNRFLVTTPPIAPILTTELIETDYDKFSNNNRTIVRPAVAQVLPDRNRIPVAETEATLAEVPITPAGSIQVSSSPPSIEGEYESTLAVEVEAQENTSPPGVQDVDDNDIDEAEDEDEDRSRSLVKKLHLNN